MLQEISALGCSVPLNWSLMQFPPTQATCSIHVPFLGYSAVLHSRKPRRSIDIDVKVRGPSFRSHYRILIEANKDDTWK